LCFFSGDENIFWKKELNLKSLGPLTGNDFEFRERERREIESVSVREGGGADINFI